MNKVLVFMNEVLMKAAPRWETKTVNRSMDGRDARLMQSAVCVHNPDRPPVQPGSALQQRARGHQAPI